MYIMVCNYDRYREQLLKVCADRRRLSLGPNKHLYWVRGYQRVSATELCGR